MNTIPTAEELYEQISVKNKGLFVHSGIEAMVEFAKLHLKAQQEAIYKNIGLIKTTAEKLNSEEYKPFVTDEDGQIWTISDKESITSAYNINLVK